MKITPVFFQIHYKGNQLQIIEEYKGYIFFKDTRSLNKCTEIKTQGFSSWNWTIHVFLQKEFHSPTYVIFKKTKLYTWKF